MKRKSIVMLLICAAVFTSVVFAALPKSASADILFQLSNNSGKTFKEIWVGPASNGKWLPRDLFVDDDGNPLRLRSGYYITLTPNMFGRQDIRKWDIRVVTTDGRKHECHNIDMYTVNHIEVDRSYRWHFSR